jgi:hypothetical protein
MKKAVIFICGAVIAGGLIVYAGFRYAQQTEASGWLFTQWETDAYVFPVTPADTPEIWAGFQSHQEMTEVCQIPYYILETISTEGLIQTCLNYPMLANVLFTDSVESGFRGQRARFNGLYELSAREDAAYELLRIFLLIDPGALKTIDNSSDSLQYRYFCFILAQDEIITQLAPEQKRLLIRAVRRHERSVPAVYSDGLLYLKSLLS